MKWMTKPAVIRLFTVLVITGLLSFLAGSVVFAQDDHQTAGEKNAAIESITVTGEGNATEMVIKLSATATYTSYKTTAPLRLVIDFSQAIPASLVSPQKLNRGNFKSFTANRFDTDAGVLTRVEIELVKDAEAVIVASPEKPAELRVSFPSLVVNASVPPVSASKKSEDSAIGAVTPSKAEMMNQSDKATPVEVSAENLIRTLTAISAQADSIVLKVDGGAGEIKSFRLNNPERFVVDLLDTRNSIASRIIPLNIAGIASARIGLYPDKTRVVLDSVNGSFPEARAEKSSEGVTVALHPAPVSADTPKAPAPVVEKKIEAKPVPVVKEEAKISKPKPEIKTNQEVIKVKPEKTISAGPTSIEMVDFQVIEGISRVSVKIKGAFVASQPVKSPGFVTVAIKNAELPKRLQRSLETKSFASPVLRVTPLSIKTRKGFDTKIRISMRRSAPFEFRQEEDMLYVDFKNPDGLVAEKLPAEIQESKPKASQASKAAKSKDNDLASELTPSTETPVKTIDGKVQYKGRRVTLEFADAEVRKIFQLLSEVSNKNFVLGDDVTGTISIKLVNVPWDQALDIILDTKGLEKREDGNIIIIKGRGKFKSQSEEEQEIKKALTRAIELKTEMFSINYSDVGSIVTQLNALKSDRGSITQDSRTNKVIVKDIPQVLDDMRQLILQLDVPEKQVMIEARIVEATSTFTRSLGVNWGVHYRDGSASLFGINQMDTSFGGIASTAAPTTGLSGNSGGAMGISFGTLTSNIQLDLRLNAAASAGLVKIVSTPKVATLNNKTAKITQGQQVPYTSSTSDKVETKFVEAALSLEVTPHINANGTIGMKIDAKNDSVGQATGGSSAPAINKKQATTEMLLRDGETTVIGGIYVDSDNESDDGVPYLMDIPFLGKLFRSNAKTKVKTELLIFITPRILGVI